MAGPTVDATLQNGMTAGQRYEFIAASITRKRQIRTALDNILTRITSGALSEADARKALQGIGAVGQDAQSITAVLSTPGGDSLMAAIDAQIGNLDEQMARLANQAINLDPVRGLVEDSRIYEFLDLKDRINLIDDLGITGGGGGSGGGGGGGWAPAAFQFQTLPNGDILSFNPNDGSVSKVGNYPDAVQKQVEVDRNGNLVSINPFTGETSVLKEGFGFAQVDPRVEFQTQTALGLANIDIAQRGQWVSALGQDMANRIQIGMLTYEEARTDVNTVVQALNQRRADTELALKYAVPKSSIFVDANGQRMTRLPGAEALSNILADSTGQRINGLFDLPVGTIDPNSSANDVVRAGQYTSPIPGLMSDLNSTRDMVSKVLSAPVADAEVARAAAAKITGGM